MALYSDVVGVTLKFNIKDQDDVVFNLSSYDVQLFVQGNVRSPFELIKLDALNGVAVYIITAGDFPAGTYQAQIKIFLDANPIFFSDIFNLGEVKQSLS